MDARQQQELQRCFQRIADRLLDEFVEEMEEIALLFEREPEPDLVEVEAGRFRPANEPIPDDLVAIEPGWFVRSSELANKQPRVAEGAARSVPGILRYPTPFALSGYGGLLPPSAGAPSPPGVPRPVVSDQLPARALVSSAGPQSSPPVQHVAGGLACGAADQEAQHDEPDDGDPVEPTPLPIAGLSFEDAGKLVDAAIEAFHECRATPPAIDVVRDFLVTTNHHGLYVDFWADDPVGAVGVLLDTVCPDPDGFARVYPGVPFALRKGLLSAQQDLAEHRSEVAQLVMDLWARWLFRPCPEKRVADWPSAPRTLQLPLRVSRQRSLTPHPILVQEMPRGPPACLCIGPLFRSRSPSATTSRGDCVPAAVRRLFHAMGANNSASTPDFADSAATNLPNKSHVRLTSPELLAVLLQNACKTNFATNPAGPRFPLHSAFTLAATGFLGPLATLSAIRFEPDRLKQRF